MSGIDESNKALQQSKPKVDGLSKYVKLNVGGYLFQTTISTLTKVGYICNI